MSDVNGGVGRDSTDRRSHGDLESSRLGSASTGSSRAADESRTIPRPADEQLVARVDDRAEVVGAGRSTFDIPATIAGALATLGTLVLLSSLLSAAIGTIGYQSGIDGDDLSVGGLVAGLVVLFLSCLVGGWVAGRVARNRGALHGLVHPVWLLLLAGLLALLGAMFGDDLADATERVGLPSWFSEDALTTAAIISGLAALALMFLGGWLGGKLAERHRSHESVAVVETRRAVSERPGGIVRGRGN